MNFAKELLDNGFVSDRAEYDYRDNFYGASKSRPDVILHKGDCRCYISFHGFYVGTKVNYYSVAEELWDSGSVTLILFMNGKEEVGRWVCSIPSDEDVINFVNLSNK